LHGLRLQTLVRRHTRAAEAAGGGRRRAVA
jgi:hypothetical protein